MSPTSVVPPIDGTIFKYPDSPVQTKCKFCGESYERALVKKGKEGLTFHCPKCGELLDDERISTNKQLRENLQQNFQLPISKLNDETQLMWQRTVKFAQWGYILRMALSVVVFIIGTVILILSSWRILFGSLSAENVYGVGVSFVSGLGTMLFIVYKGPLKEIRHSVTDLGIASAAFIGYIHQVLQISHTFSYYYLNQKINFHEMKTANELIQKAMLRTTGILNLKKDESNNKESGSE